MLNGRAYLGVFVSLCIAAISLCLFQVTSKWGLSFNFIFLFLAGACQCGPDSVVAGALASEIGTRENAQSAVSGVVNGKFSFIGFMFFFSHHPLHVTRYLHQFNYNQLHRRINNIHGLTKRILISKLRQIQVQIFMTCR